MARYVIKSARHKMTGDMTGGMDNAWSHNVLGLSAKKVADSQRTKKEKAEICRNTIGGSRREDMWRGEENGQEGTYVQDSNI